MPDNINEQYTAPFSPLPKTLEERMKDVHSTTYLKVKDANYSIPEKAKIVEENGLNRILQVDDYRKAKVIFSADGDSYSIVDENNQLINGRMANESIAFSDTVELPHYGEQIKSDINHIIDTGFTSLAQQDKSTKSNSLVRRDNTQEELLARSNRNVFISDLVKKLPKGTLTDDEEFALRQPNTLLSDELKVKINTKLDEAIERNKSIFNKQLFVQDIMTNKNKSKQLDMVSELLNKPVNEVTADDIINVGNWQKKTIIDQIKANSTSIREPFNPSTFYGNTSIEEPVEIMYKSLGKDKYGRELVDIVNPRTKQQVSFESAKDPYLNANFSLVDIVDTPKNRAKQSKAESDAWFNNYAKNVADGDGYVGELVDLAQSSIYKAVASVGVALTPKSIMDMLDSYREENHKATFTDMVDPRLGQEIVDTIAGVKPDTRNKIQQATSKAEQSFEDGDYLKGLYMIGKHIPMYIADSTAHTLGLTAATLVSGGGVALGLMSKGLGSLIVGGAIATLAVDMTASNSKQFEENNKDLEYTPEQYALDFTINALTLIPEAILVKTGLLSFIKKPLVSALKRLPDRSTYVTAFKAIVGGILGEGIQEAVQGTSEEYFTQNLQALREVSDIVQDPSIWVQGAIGALTGGALVGTAVTPSIVVEGVKNRQYNKATKKQEEYKTTHTLTGEVADDKTSTNLISRIEALEIKSNKLKEIDKEIEQYRKELVQDIDTINVKSIEKLANKEIEILVDKLNKGILDIDSLTQEEKEKLFKKSVFHYKSLDNISNNSNKAQDAIYEIAKKLSIPKELVAKTWREVEYEASYSPLGYYTYGNILDTIDTLLLDDNLTEEQTDRLTQNKNTVYKKLEYFGNTQAIKLDKFIEAIKAFNDINAPKIVKVDNFEINKSDVLTGDYDTGKGLFTVIRGAVNNIKGINDILSSHNFNANIEYKDRLDTFNSIIDSIRDLRSTNIKKVEDKHIMTKTDYNAIYKAASNYLKDEKYYGRMYRDTVIKYGKDNIKNTIDALSKFNNKKYNPVIELLTDEVTVIDNKDIRTKLKEDNKVKEIETTVNDTVDTSIEASIPSTIEDNTETDTNIPEQSKPTLEDTTDTSTVQDTEIPVESKQETIIEVPVTIGNDSTDIVSEVEVLEEINTDLTDNTEPIIQYKADEEVAEIFNTVVKDYNINDKPISKLFSESDMLEVQNKEFKQIEQILLLSKKEAEYLEDVDKLNKDIVEYSKSIEAYRKESNIYDIHSSVYKDIKNTIKEINKLIDDSILAKDTLYDTKITDTRTKIDKITSSISNTYMNTLISDNKLFGISEIARTDKAIEKGTKAVKITPINQIIKAKQSAFSLLGSFKLNKDNKVVQKIAKDVIDSIDTNYFKFKVSNDNPALAFLYTDDKEGKSKNYNVAFAIDYAMKYILYNEGYRFKVKTAKDAERLLGDIGDVGSITTMVNNILEHGVLRQSMADYVGTSVFNLLGIEVDKTKSSQEEYKRLINNIGNTALVYAESKGWIIDTKVDRDTTVTEDSSAPFYHLIKSNLSADTTTEIREHLEEYEGLILDKNMFENRVPLSYKPKRSVMYYVKHSDKLVKVYDIAVNAINKLKSTKFYVNTDAVDYVKAYPEVIKKYLGYTEDTSNMSYVKAESIKASNLAIEKEIADLISLADTGKQTWYLDWFFGKNGRYYVNSVTVNPQESKLHRFLFTPVFKKEEQTVYMNDKKSLETFRYILAQAFSFAVDNKTDKERESFVDKLTVIPAESIREALTNNTLNKLKLDLSKISHIGQFLIGIDALQQYQDALINGEDSFVTKLVGEQDSTTNGYAIKLLQYPLKELKPLFEKVGLQSDNTRTKTIHNLKNKKGFLDIYKTIASNFKSMDTEEYRDTLLVNAIIESPITTVDKDVAVDVYSKIKQVLINIDNTEEVSPELRKLFKSPTMESGYGAGEARIASNLGVELADTMVNDYLKYSALGKDLSSVKDINHYNAIMNLFNPIKDAIPNLIAKLTSLPIDKIVLPKTFISGNTRITLKNYIEDTIALSYGNVVASTLEQTFKPLYAINYFIGESFKFMFKIFSAKLDRAIKAHERKHGKVTIEAEEEIIKSLFKYIPMIETVFSSIDEKGLISDGVPIFDKTRKVSKSDKGKTTVYFNKKNEHFTNKDTQSISLRTRITAISEAVSSGLVLPIHYIDGAMMGKLIEEFTVMPIHDAKISSLANFDITNKKYNELFYTINKEYSIIDAIYNKLDTLLNDPTVSLDIDKMYLGTTGKGFEKYYQYFNNTIVEDKVSFRQFVQQLSNLNATVQAARLAYYSSNNVAISNMDGLNNSIFRVKEHKKQLEERKETVLKAVVDSVADELGSTSETFTTEGELIKLHNEALNDPTVRLSIMDKLHSLNPSATNTEHFNHLRELIGSIDGTALSEVVAYVAEHSNITAGKFNVKNKNIILGMSDNYNKNTLEQNSSVVESYSHELIHAITHEIIFNANKYKQTRTVRKIQELYRIASGHFTAEDFLPDVITNPITDGKKANELYNYIFNNDNKVAMQGLNEFIAYGLTNKKFMDKLKTIPITKETTSTTLLEKIMSLGKQLLDAFFNSKNIALILPRLSSIVVGTSTIKDRYVYDSLNNLVHSLASADNKAMQTLYNNPFRGIEKLFEYTYGTVRRLNKILGLRRIVNVGNNLKVNFSVSKYEQSFIEDLKDTYKIFVLAPINKHARARIPLILRMLGLQYHGIVLSTITDISEPDDASARLEQLGLMTRKIDGIGKAIEKAAYQNLKQGFERDLTAVESEVLTKTLLYTDVQSLMATMSYEDIESVLFDSNKRNKRINALQTRLDTITEDSNLANWYYNQIQSLAYYMQTNKGHEALLLNANNIAKGIGYDIDYTAKYTDETIQLIEQLVTLNSLNLIPEESIKVLKGLKSTGIKNYILSHNEYVKESKNEDVEERHMIKGYTKNLLDNSYDFQVLPASAEFVMKEQGYTLIEHLADNKVTGKKGFALYRSNLADLRRRNGSTFMFYGEEVMGTTLHDLAKEDTNLSNIDSYKALAEKYKVEAFKYHNKINDTMKKYRYNDVEKLIGIGSRFIPVVSSENSNNNSMLNNGINTYRITMDNAVKEQYLGQNLNGLNILSKMFASSEFKKLSKEQNNKIFKFLIKDMDTNYIKNIPISYKNNKNYVTLSPESDNAFIKDAYMSLPKDMKKAILSYTGKDINAFAVREDWLRLLFGIKEISLIDAPIINHTPVKVKYAIKIAEMILKFVGTFYKSTIIIRTPAVLIGNIISNINIGLAEGYSLIDIIKMYFDNFRNVRDYTVTRDKLNDLQYKRRIGTATDKELILIERYKEILQQNPVHVLVKKGMYQPIIEDISPEELDSTSKVTKWINKKTSFLPKHLKTALKHIYMLEGTPLYQFLFAATQYSDFVARATEYQLRMKEAPKDITSQEYKDYEEQVSFKILNTYINYDKPVSALEQYANDIGLVLFTKFFKRIQHVIFKGALDNPVSSAMFLASQYTIMDTDDIFEQTIFTKSLLNSVYNPFFNAFDLLTPATAKLLGSALD